MASFLVRLWRDVLDRQCPDGGAPFTDVATGSTHAANIDCVYSLGITKGVTTTTYGPGDNLAASQISRFLLRTYEKAGETCPDLESELDEAVTCLEALNVIPDVAEGRSRKDVTRAQMAVYMVGLWHNITGRGLPPAPPAFGAEGAPVDAPSEGGPGTLARLAIEVLEELAVAPEQRSGYDRDLFAHWSDLDGDGCDTRREVLIRDSRIESVRDPNRTCWVVSGLWYSYYDDEWVQGPSSLDIDHLVPLAEAWDSGAHSWSTDRREEFANDEGALVAVTSGSNRSKGARDPAEWMPPNDDFTCPYISAWVATKARWGLSVDRRESDFLQGLLAGGCAGTTLDIRTPLLGFPVSIRLRWTPRPSTLRGTRPVHHRPPFRPIRGTLGTVVTSPPRARRRSGSTPTSRTTATWPASMGTATGRRARACHSRLSVGQDPVAHIPAVGSLSNIPARRNVSSGSPYSEALRRVSEEYLARNRRSREMADRAAVVLPGGTTRTTTFFAPFPPVLVAGEGSVIVDVDGNRRVDYLNNYTSLILGHAHPDVVDRAMSVAGRGTAFSSPTEQEVRLAEVLVERVDSVDQVRFTNSGTEATMAVMRMARAFTGRPKVARFEGSYHGTHDYTATPGPGYRT